jgi:hypothetical protein
MLVARVPYTSHLSIAIRLKENLAAVGSALDNLHCCFLLPSLDSRWCVPHNSEVVSYVVIGRRTAAQLRATVTKSQFVLTAGQLRVPQCPP